MKIKSKLHSPPVGCKEDWEWVERGGVWVEKKRSSGRGTDLAGEHNHPTHHNHLTHHPHSPA